jgi:hypothetical protein
MTRVSQPQRFERILQGEGVDDGRQHAHVVRGCFLDRGVLPLELGPAKDVAAADDQSNLAADLRRLLDLPRNMQHFLHADAALGPGEE